jgi:hypothetical protein
MTLRKHASPGVQAGVSAFKARLRRHKALLGRLLLFNVLANDADRRATARRREIGWRPQNTLPIPAHQFRPHLPQSAAGHPFEAVHQRRKQHRGRIIHKGIVKRCALRYAIAMADKRIINARVTDEEAETLSAYSDETGQSQTDVLRAFIRSLEGRLRRVSAEQIVPDLLPSLPLSRRDMFPPVSAVYFFVKENGEVLYVGETADMSLRCGSHPRYDAALEADPHARLHWIERRTGRVAFEDACIKRFQPPLNVWGKRINVTCGPKSTAQLAQERRQRKKAGK